MQQTVYTYFTTYPVDQILADWKKGTVVENPTLNIAGAIKSLCKLLQASQLLMAGTGFSSCKDKTHCRGSGYESYQLPQVNRKKPFSISHGYYSKTKNHHDEKAMQYILSAEMPGFLLDVAMVPDYRKETRPPQQIPFSLSKTDLGMLGSKTTAQIVNTMLPASGFARFQKRISFQ